jgi:hypothetical protein
MLLLDYPILGRTAQEEEVERVLRCDEDDWNEVLEITHTCTKEEANKAYKRLALAVHPDKNPHENAGQAFISKVQCLLLTQCSR